MGSTVFYKDLRREFATGGTITKADRPLNFTIFHCRMNTIQPAWVDCTTSKSWHTCCWHFCSCSSPKTIPSLKELLVTPLLVQGCYVTALSTGITQALIIITWDGWKRLNRNLKNVKESKVNIFPWYLVQNQFNKKQMALAFFEKKKIMETLVTQLLRVRCYLSFYWHRSSFHNDSKDRLESEMTVSKVLRLLKSMVQDFL